MVTISTHNGSLVHQGHNIRQKNVVSKEEHIDLNGVHETWIHEPVRMAYQRLFDESVQKYNEKQMREDRQIKNYFNKVRADAKKNTAYEMIIGVYGKDENGVYQCSEELGKEIMKEFVATWKDRNPNLELIGAYYHADEKGEPHVHIDYIPIAHNYSKGMETQTGLVKALKEMGFEKHGKVTSQILWERRENEYFAQLCENRGLEVYHPRKENVKHIDTQTYKAKKTLENALNQTKDILSMHDDLNAEISKLEAIRDKAEVQAQKGIERKQKAFDRSWKKDKETGWFYDKTLQREIEELVKERSEDVKAICKTDLDVQRQYDVASSIRNQIEKEVEMKRRKAEEELEKVKEYRENQEIYIKRTANREAQRMFKDFIEREFSSEMTEKEERLRQFCENVKFQDGQSVLDKFETHELERKQALEKEWDRGWSR